MLSHLCSGLILGTFHRERAAHRFELDQNLAMAVSPEPSTERERLIQSRWTKILRAVCREVVLRRVAAFWGDLGQWLRIAKPCRPLRDI